MSAFVMQPIPEPDFEQIGWALANEAGYWSREEHAGRCVAASIAEQLRQVWNARGAADIVRMDAEVFADGTSREGFTTMLERAIKELDR